MTKVIAAAINNARMIPVFYFEDIETNISVIDACFKGGLRVVEFVNRGEAAETNFPILKEHVQKECLGMIIGVGSILNQEQADKFIRLGADFIVSPILNKEISETCKKQNIYWIPGCATPTEIAKANELGADIIKVFPGNVLGPGFIKSVLGPMRGLKLMPTGGVDPTKDNLTAWFNAGAVCVGMGSKLISRELIGQPELFVKKIKELVEMIKNIRS